MISNSSIRHYRTTKSAHGHLSVHVFSSVLCPIMYWIYIMGQILELWSQSESLRVWKNNKYFTIGNNDWKCTFSLQSSSNSIVRWMQKKGTDLILKEKKRITTCKPVEVACLKCLLELVFQVRNSNSEQTIL